MKTRIKIMVLRLLSAVLVTSCMAPAFAGSGEEALAATADFFAKMSTGDLISVSRYLPGEGFTETVPETEQLLRLDVKAFESLFKSGRKVDLRVAGTSAQIFGDAAIVTGKRIGSITNAGVPPVEGEVAFSMIWTRHDGRLLLRHLHLSHLPASK